MNFYHGTTEDFWKGIQEEGVLWGRKNVYFKGNKLDRVTWFAKDIGNAGIFDERGLTKKICIILEIDFPNILKWDGWQMVVYDPVPITRIKNVYKFTDGKRIKRKNS